MRPTLGEYVNIELTKEQSEFDIAIAENVMGWKRLDSSLQAQFEQHILPDSTYPFYETFGGKGIVNYHPTPYHGIMFSPSINYSDDVAVLTTYLSKHPEQLNEILTTLHFIQHQRSLKDSGFNPSDDYYRATNYYRIGDFSTAIWHSLKKDSSVVKKLNETAIINGKNKMLGKYSIHTINFDGSKFVVYCSNKSLITKEIEDYFTSEGYSVVFHERA
jgi:hypothetical protein